jgi:hypothetical protein
MLHVICVMLQTLLRLCQTQITKISLYIKIIFNYLFQCILLKSETGLQPISLKQKKRLFIPLFFKIKLFTVCIINSLLKSYHYELRYVGYMSMLHSFTTYRLPSKYMINVHTYGNS